MVVFWGNRIIYECSTKPEWLLCLCVFSLQRLAVKSKKKKKKEKKWSCSSLSLFSLHEHKSLQSAVHCGIEEVPDRSIIVEDYSNEVIGHWPGNMWPRKQTNEIWFRVRLRSADRQRQTDRQTGIPWFPFNLSTCCSRFFKPAIFQIFECWLSSCWKSETSKIKWTCCAYPPPPPFPVALPEGLTKSCSCAPDCRK